jgi:hypothetical protein
VRISSKLKKINPITGKKEGTDMNRIVYVIGLVVVVLFIASYIGLR